MNVLKTDPEKKLVEILKLFEIILVLYQLPIQKIVSNEILTFAARRRRKCDCLYLMLVRTHTNSPKLAAVASTPWAAPAATRPTARRWPRPWRPSPIALVMAIRSPMGPVIKLVKVVAKEEKALEIGFSVENAKDV
jgi:hypothetical protein